MKPVDPQLLRLAAGIRPLLLVSVGAGVLAAAATVGQALLLASILADVIIGGAGPTDLTTQFLALLVVVPTRALLVGAGDHLANRAARRVAVQLRRDLLLAASRLSPRERAAGRSAELSTLAGPGIESIELYLATYLPQLVLAVAVPGGLVATLFWLDPTSGWVVLLTLPLIPLFMALIGWYTERVARTRWRTLQTLSAHFAEVVAGLPTLKAYGRADRQAEQVRAVTGDYRRTTMKTLRVAFLSSLVLELLATLSVALVAVAIGIRLVSGNLTLTVGLAVLILAPEAYAPLRALGTRFHAAADGVAAVQQLLPVLQAPVPASGTRKDISATPTMRLESVRIRLDDEREIGPLDEDLRPGSVLAVTGPSGSGKTSLLHAVLGLSVPEAGAITLDGVPVTELDPAARSRVFGYAGQGGFLRAGTVAENMLLGNPDLTADRMRAALAAVGLAGWLGDQPVGTDTLLGDGGAGMSAGQRQRLALARALAGCSPVLVLDEPTARLDRDTETMVLQGIRRLAAGRTVILVTHRPAPLALADRTLDLGRTEVSA